MKRRLILHLGLPKTGSTSLQTFLRGHPAALAEAGVHYPVSSSDEAGVRAPGAGKPYIEREISHALLAQEIKRRGDAPDPTQTPRWSTALRRIEESGAAVGVISYEHFSTQPRLYRFAALRARLADFHVTGTLYLREPESWAVSLYGQILRRRDRPTFSFGEFLAAIEITGEFSRLLDNMRAHVPVDDLVVGEFESAAERGLIADFLSMAGVSGEALSLAAAHPAKNSASPVGALLFLLRCNRAALPEAPAAEVRKALTRLAARGEMPDFRPGLDLASPEEREPLREAAAADADRLRNRYGVGFAAAVRPSSSYRPFDDRDFAILREALAPRLSPAARAALAQA